MRTDLARLGDLAKFNPPTPKGLLASDTEVAVVPMAAVSEQGHMQVHEYRSAKEVSSGLSYFADGDVLVAKITPCYENNKITQAKVDRDHAFGSTEFHVLRPDENKLDGRYLTHFLRQDAVRQVGVRRMTGSGGQRRVPRNFLEQLQIPLPPLDEQRRIAAILDQADALRRKRRASLRTLESLAEATFKDAIDQISFNATSRLGDHLSFITSGGRNWSRFYTDKGARFIRSYDVQMGEVTDDEEIYVTPPDNAEAKRTVVNNGDVLLTITGSRIGRVSPISERLAGSYVSQHVAILRPKDSLLPGYLSAYIALPSGGQQTIARMQYGQTKPGLNFDQIRKFSIPVPPLDTQKEIVGHLSKIVSLGREASEQADKFDALFASLQHRAFRGEL